MNIKLLAVCFLSVICLLISPVSYAEDISLNNLPSYEPVELAYSSDRPILPLPSPRQAHTTPYAPNPDNYIYDAETGLAKEYLDSTIHVKVESRIISNTKVFFTWIQIADPSQFRTVVSSEANPVRQAKRFDAIVAINGDWFSFREEGVIYRNGELMRKAKRIGNYDELIIDMSGDFHILYRPKVEEFDQYTDNILHSFHFGPALVIDGEKQIFNTTEYGSGKGMGLGRKEQRQAICQMGKLSYLIITTEGPKQSKGGGFTIQEFADLAFACGVTNAYNLDGAGSTCLAFNGVKLNRYGRSNICYVSDILYFITADNSVNSSGYAQE